MARTIIDKIECDACGKDIGPHKTGYPHAFILKLSAKDMAINEGVVFAIAMRPPTKDLYFCGFDCVGMFVDSKRANEKAQKETTARLKDEARARGDNFYLSEAGNRITFGSI